MTAILIDIAIIGIIAFCAWRGYKSGLIRGVFGVVSMIAALLVANVTANAYSKEAQSVILPFAAGIIDSTLSDMSENDIRYQPIAHNHDVNSPIFGEAYMVLRQIGLPEAAAVNLAKQMAEEFDIEEKQDEFIDLLAEKLTDTLSHVAVFAIAFLVLAIIFAVLGNLVGFVFSLPGLKLVDTISGTIFGLAKGIILVLAISLIIRYFGLLARSTLESTLLLNHLVNNNPVANMFGI